MIDNVMIEYGDALDIADLLDVMIAMNMFSKREQILGNDILNRLSKNIGYERIGSNPEQLEFNFVKTL